MEMLLVALLSLAVVGQHRVVVDDFEAGLEWVAVAGGSAEAPSLRRVEDAADGYAAMEVRFRAGMGRAAARRAVKAGEWIDSRCDRLVVWMKASRPPGSGEKVRVWLQDAAGRTGVSPRRLAPGRQWQAFELPLAGFRLGDGGQMELGKVVALEVGFEGRVPDATLLVDEVYAAPERESWYWDLVIPCEGGWGHRNPGMFTIGNDGRVRPSRAIGQFVHGRVNHPEMRTPFAFGVHYPVRGRFEVYVGETSGWGGAGLVIKVDGQEKLRREFPADVKRGVHKYDGWYGIDVPAGQHTIELDNAGADWTRITRIRLRNYKSWHVRQLKRGGVVEVVLMGANGRPVGDAAVCGEVGGMDVRFRMVRPGVYRSPPLAPELGPGTYWLRIDARRDGQTLMRYGGPLRIRKPTVRPRRIAFCAGEEPTLVLECRNEAGVAVEGAAGMVAVAGRAIPLRSVGEGVVSAPLPPLRASRYTASVRLMRPRAEVRLPIVVYERQEGPLPGQAFVQLGKDRVFRCGGQPFVPLGYACIHMFEPVPGLREIRGGWTESAWCNAPEEVVADWLGFVASHDVNVVRFGLTVKWDGVNGDLGGYASERFMAALRRMADIAGSMGIRLLPVFYWGHWGTFGFSDVPAYVPLMKDWRSWFLERRALELQARFVRQVVREFAGDPRIFAWEPMNEIIPGVDGDMGVSVRWVNFIADTIRRVDRRHLITESPNTRDSVAHLFYSRTARVDFINYHWYTDHRQPAVSDCAALAIHGKLNQLGPIPAIIGEAGFTGHFLGGRNYLDVTLATRDIFWISLLAGSNGLIGWDGATTAPEEIPMVRRVLERAGWARRRRARSDVVVVASDIHRAYGRLYELQRQAFRRGLSLDIVLEPHEAGEWRRAVDAGREGAKLPAGVWGPVVPSGHYQAYPWQSEDGRVVIAYVWNEAGFNGVGNRARKASALSLRLRLPRMMKVYAYDLDAQEIAAEWGPLRRARVELPRGIHDYVIVAVAAE